MAIQDKSVTLVGAQTILFSLTMMPNQDGSTTIVASGSTKDSLGNIEQLNPARIIVQPGQVAAVDNMMARALSELRKANGLEV